MSEYLDRKQVIELYEKYQPSLATNVYEFGEKLKALPMMALPIAELDTAEDFAEWIPCSERLPNDMRPVIVTWKNTDPASYYQYIVGKHYIGTAHYYRGKWYWYSSVTEDFLAEYGKCDTEEFDEAIECIAWMPLPEPYQKEGD